MQLTIYRGTREIGGSCLEVSTASTRIILDVGLPLVDIDRKSFDPKSIRGLSIQELSESKILPKVAGLFNEGKAPDCILLSHSHLDHAGLLHLTKPEIPIYATSGTSKMMLAGALFSQQTGLERQRHREIKPQEPFYVGDIRVLPLAVDHSSFGSVAFLIESEGKRILYSGDIRMHGRKPGMIRELVAEVADKGVDLLVMEGTHFGSDRSKGQTEYELENQIADGIKTADSIVLACFSPVDVDRLVTYYRACQRSGRIFVVDAYAAFVMHLVSTEAKIPRPLNEAGIRVYFNKSFENRKLERVKQIFESNRVHLNEVLASPDRFVMVFRPSMLDLDFEGVLPSLSRCFYSYWKGYLERNDWVELQKSLSEVGGEFLTAHTSGHIYIEDIIDFVGAIKPKQIVPIHTFEPKRFFDHFDNVRLLEDGEPLQV